LNNKDQLNLQPGSNPETETGFDRQTELVVGTSLWKDAWRRLLKNKLAVFGLIVVSTIIIALLIDRRSSE
jgi:oligopeptide transport system permease protein